MQVSDILPALFAGMLAHTGTIGRPTPHEGGRAGYLPLKYCLPEVHYGRKYNDRLAFRLISKRPLYFRLDLYAELKGCCYTAAVL